MSKENVVFFVRAAHKKTELGERLAKTDKTADWVNIADEAGFEFTADEFCAVIEEIINKRVTAENAVREYLATRATLGSGELDKRALEGVVGGAQPGPARLKYWDR